MMQPAVVTVRCPACRTGGAQVDGWSDRNLPGLAATPAHAHPPYDEVVRDAWVVTHLPSGIQVGNVGFRPDDGEPVSVARERAVRAVQLLGALPVDWTLPVAHPSLQSDELKRVMGQIMDDCSAWRHDADDLTEG